MRLDLITAVLDTVSFVLVTPRLVGLDNLRRFNRSGFSFLSRVLFDNTQAITLSRMILITVVLCASIALVMFVEVPWLIGRDAALFGPRFNAAHALTPLNVTLAFAGFLTYVVAPLTLMMGWLEVLMTRYDPEAAMLLAGGVLFAIARFISILQATALAG